MFKRIIIALAIRGKGERKKNRGGKNIKDQKSRPSTSHNSGYAVRAEYRPLPNCLRYAT